MLTLLRPVAPAYRGIESVRVRLDGTQLPFFELLVQLLIFLSEMSLLTRPSCKCHYLLSF